MPDLDLNKPIKTRDGRLVRIICTDRNHIDGPIVALVTTQTPGHEEELLMSCFKDGSYVRGMKHDNDLINVVERVMFENVFAVTGPSGRRYTTLGEAQRFRDRTSPPLSGYLIHKWENEVYVGATFISYAKVRG